MDMHKFKDIVFWKDGFTGRAEGGFYFRSFELNKFMEKITEKGDNIVGISFTGNNCEIICESKQVEELKNWRLQNGTSNAGERINNQLQKSYEN